MSLLYMGVTYKDLISVIPKMETDNIRELIAHLQLELKLRHVDEDTYE